MIQLKRTIIVQLNIAPAAPPKIVMQGRLRVFDGELIFAPLIRNIPDEAFIPLPTCIFPLCLYGLRDRQRG